MAEHEHLYPCPHCRKGFIWTDENPHRPFCSERCQLLDLSKWLNEEHRIPGESGMDEVQPRGENES